jgi:hypothetical protein
MSASIGIFCIETRKKYWVLSMASWLIGAPGEMGNSRFRNRFMQERVEAKPMLSAAAPATIEMIAATTTTTLATSATKTKLNRSAIKSSMDTNERSRANVVR